MKYKCTICGYIYDEDVEKVLFKDLPNDWACPACGAPKDLFEPLEEKTVEINEIESANDMEEFSYLELAAIFSNLARGSEKQYKMAWQQGFNDLANYFTNKAEKENTDNIALLELLKEDMTKYYPSLMSEAKDKGDRGLLRALTWGEKVTNMAKNLLERYLKEGPSFLEGKKIYVCSICGFIYVGNNLPNICPVCKVPSFKFVEIKEDLK